MAHQRIEINPEVMGGKPVIRGTRVPVELILRKLGAGMTAEAIIADHPRLSLEDIQAAQAFAADYIADEDIVYRWELRAVRWLADECVDAGLIARLRDTEHDVLYIAEVAEGASDAEVLRRAEVEARLLLTEDKGFGELVFRSDLPVPGVVLLRLDSGKHLL
jgi:uncharacterized protein (DUF433 family)